jgi:hypothetical protein
MAIQSGYNSTSGAAATSEDTKFYSNLTVWRACAGYLRSAGGDKEFRWARRPRKNVARDYKTAQTFEQARMTFLNVSKRDCCEILLGFSFLGG